MNHEQLKILRSAGSKIQFLIQTIEDESEIKKLENISRLIGTVLLSSNPVPKIKPMLVSYSPGYTIHCPKCNGTKVLLFFDPRFEARYETKWNELIDNRNIILENRWNKIKVENDWDNIDPKDAVPNWNCKDCYDGGIIVEYPIDKKIADEFKKCEKTFTEKSEPLYWDKYGEKITLKQIHGESNIGNNSLVLIAVTRQQYNTDNFAKYREYIKNTLAKNMLYYGLWFNTDNGKVEYDILYSIENNLQEIQKHLNLHNQINNGVMQKIALIIDKDGNWNIQNNESYSQTTSNSLGGI
jgi:hypothetical protein